MNNKRNSSSSFNWKKVVGIIVAVLVIVALILSLISCQKKKSNSDKPKERKVEEKDKKPKKKDKDDNKLEVVEEDVVIYSDFSNDNSTAKVTKTSNNTNNASKKEEKKDEDPVDTTDPEISDVTKAIVENTNTIALTFTVTDKSAVEVKIGEEVLTAVEGQYKFVATENGSYTITATDANGNIGTKIVEVSQLITDTELESVYIVKDKKKKDTTIEVKDNQNIIVKTRKYVSTKNDSGNITPADFSNGASKVTVNDHEYDIHDFGTKPGPEQQPKIDHKFHKDGPGPDASVNNYVYYEVTKTTTEGDNTYTATAANVKYVEFEQD